MLKNNYITYIFLLVLAVGCVGTIITGGKPMTESVRTEIKAYIEQSDPQILTFGKKIVAIVERNYSSNFVAQNVWVEAYSAFCKLQGKRIILDSQKRYTVYKMDNGLLTWNYQGYDVDSYADSYIKFAGDMDKNGIPLVYVQAPFKINKYDNELPHNLPDTTNAMTDQYLQRIESAGCEVCDLRECIEEEGLDYNSLFFRTDHHWKPETGLWATHTVVEKLNESHDLNLDDTYLKEECYKKTEYQNVFLGSQGKRTGMVYSGLDDLTILEPNYDTKYTYTIPKIEYDKMGTYSETLLMRQYMEDNIYDGDPSRVYTGDNYPLSIIHNHNATNGRRILLVRDSFSRGVTPFLASTCEELYSVDLRSFDGSVVEFAKEKQVDVVIVLYNPSTVVNAEFYSFE